MDGGRPTATIDEVPLNFRHLPDGHVVRPEEVEAEPARVGHKLRPLDIVVVATSAGVRHGEDDYLNSGCGMGRNATLFLLERGVRVTGTDAWSWDAPFASTAERWAESRDPSIIWKGHRASMVHGYCHMEKLSNLDAPHPAALDMEVHVNGGRWGGGSSGDMRHDSSAIIAHVSADEALHPGEVIGSGTVGTGCGLELGRRLADGDEMALTIAGIGALRNTIRKVPR